MKKYEGSQLKDYNFWLKFGSNYTVNKMFKIIIILIIYGW